MVTPRIGSFVVLSCVCFACSPGADPQQEDAAVEDAAQPLEPSLDAGGESLRDAAAPRADVTVAPADATVSMPDTGAPGLDASPARPVVDAASAPPTPALDAGAVVVDVEAGSTVSDASVPAVDAWVFQPNGALRDAGARRTVMPGIPEAENLFFTEDGRLFVSGGENVFEIKRDAAGKWTKTDLFDEKCLVEGITHANGYIYGVCSLTELDTFAQAYLLGGALTAEPHMKIIARLDDLGIPNGMDADPQGNLYTTYSALGIIAKLVLSAPLELARVEVWSKEDLPVVNGLRFIGDYVYITTMQPDLLGTRLGRIRIQADGSAGRAEFLLTRDLTLFDDVGAFQGGLMVTDFVTGSLLFFRDGKVLAETPELTFYGPSSVVQGKPPLFRENQLLVTEKGLFGVADDPDGGDRLSVFEL